MAEGAYVPASQVAARQEALHKARGTTGIASAAQPGSGGVAYNMQPLAARVAELERTVSEMPLMHMPAAPAIARPASFSRVGAARSPMPYPLPWAHGDVLGGGEPKVKLIVRDGEPAKLPPLGVQRLAQAPAWAHASQPGTSPREGPRAAEPASEPTAPSPPPLALAVAPAADSLAVATAAEWAQVEEPSSSQPSPQGPIVPLVRGGTTSYSDGASADDAVDEDSLERPSAAELLLLPERRAAGPPPPLAGADAEEEEAGAEAEAEAVRGEEAAAGTPHDHRRAGADKPSSGRAQPRSAVPSELPAGESVLFRLTLAFSHGAPAASGSGGGSGSAAGAPVAGESDAGGLPSLSAQLSGRDALPLLDEAGYVLEARGAACLRPCDLVLTAAALGRSRLPLSLAQSALPPNEALASLLTLPPPPGSGAHDGDLPALVLRVLRRSFVAPIAPEPPSQCAWPLAAALPAEARRPPPPEREQADSAAVAESPSPPARPAASASVRVCCVTWNMHGREPPPTVGELLHHRAPAGVRFDLFAIGTQEAERSIEASILNSSKAKWEAAIEATLGSGYVLVASHRLAAMHLAVFATVQLAPLISGVRTAHVATGVANTLGNKGGVGVSLMLGRTSLCFVSCHFTAHQGAVRARNADFRRIDESLDLWPPQPPAPGRGGSGAAGGGGGRARAPAGATRAAKASLSARFDRVFWLGDFNYRVHGNRAIVDKLLAGRTDADARAAGWASADECALESLRVLLRNDQLALQRRAGHVFRGLVEGEIRFRPTYKFDSKQREQYDCSEKARIPAWTDRVLFSAPAHGEPDGAIRLHYYSSVDAVQMSDHRPVFADLSVRFDYDPTAAAAVAAATAAAAAAGGAPQVARARTGSEEGAKAGSARGGALAAQGAGAPPVVLERSYTRAGGGRTLNDQPEPKPAGRRDGASALCVIS